MSDSFPDIRFRGTLRPSQADVVKIAREQLEAGQKQLHIVAPPGAGKTVLGLYLWAECVRLPSLVLSPNSAIQAQWANRLDLFDGPGSVTHLASTNPLAPALLSSLTYQSVTLPSRGGTDLESDAVELWIERLVEQGEAGNPEEAAVWISDLKRHNESFYKDRLSSYRKEVRDTIALGGDAMKTLHASALETLERLKQAGIGLLILDECHHLLSHWGRVLADAHSYFDHPIIVGLTATPPDFRGKPTADVERYKEFFGPVDFEVPVPAVVKDGYLAPYQDLVQFVRPTSEELAYVANADKQLSELVEELCQPLPAAEEVSSDEDTGDGENAVEGQEEPHESLTEWLLRVLAERRHAVGVAADWADFEKRDPALAWAGPRFLQWRDIPLPPGVPLNTQDASMRSTAQPGGSRAIGQMPPMMVLVPVLDRYIRRRLRMSHHSADHELAERAIRRLRMLGTQITETGSQACASPIGRVLAYARGKAEATVPILEAEHRALGDRIRAVIVTDYEKTSAVDAEVAHLLDAEAGGAIAVFRTLLRHPTTDTLDPVLVTGSTVLVDDDLAPKFEQAASEWLAERNVKVELVFGEEEGFHVLSGRGSDWCPRNYVAMVTDLFQRGITKCLVGTRGLLGEGWDASKTNVLVDLTTVTTSTSVNQLRGRSLRLDADDPAKLAHNWDVICIAPEFVKGLDDYDRFIEKHNTLFGLTDDGVIEKGVGHVHAAFTELEPELVEGSMHVLNAEMLERPARRSEFRKLWRIGEPFHAEPVHTLELKPAAVTGCAPPPYGKAVVEWSMHSLTLAVSGAILDALWEAGHVPKSGELSVERRAGSYVRAFLEGAGEEACRLFGDSLEETLGPLDRPRYVIPRFVEYRIDTWLSNILPDVVGRYFQKVRRQMEMLHAVPTVFGKNKDLATLFGRHWNRHVSPGEPFYARSEEGKERIEQAAQNGAVPKLEVRRKEAFL